MVWIAGVSERVCVCAFYKVGFIGIHMYADIVLLAYICFPAGESCEIFGRLCYSILNRKLAQAVLVINLPLFCLN